MGKAVDSILVKRRNKYAWAVGCCTVLALAFVLFAVVNVVLPHLPYARGKTSECVVIDEHRAMCGGPLLRPFAPPFWPMRHRCSKYTVRISGRSHSHVAIGKKKPDSPVNKCTTPRGNGEVVINWRFPVLAVLLAGGGTALFFGGAAWFTWQCTKYKPMELPTQS